jgi:hypothetical protein
MTRRWSKPLPAPQASLFDSRRIGPLAANADPATSKFAARAHIATGQHGRQCALVLELVRRFPFHTSRELATFAAEEGIDRFTIARRLPDLQGDGLVAKSGVRECAVGGKASVTWVAIGGASEQVTQQEYEA